MFKYLSSLLPTPPPPKTLSTARYVVHIQNFLAVHLPMTFYFEAHEQQMPEYEQIAKFGATIS